MKGIQSVKILNKKEGETPLECLQRFRLSHKQYAELPMTYAGRLDPMASGKLLVLSGEECKNKEKYLGLDKEYEVEVLFGFATDTYDILGKIVKHPSLLSLPRRQAGKCSPQRENKTEEISLALKDFVGKFEQEYPKFSSKYLSQNADPEEMYTKIVEIYSIKYVGARKLKADALLRNILRRVRKVKGEFRQKEIAELWKKNLLKKNEVFKIVKIKVKCSSGTYMRSLAQNLGKKMYTPALAFSIKRTGLINL